MAHRARVTAGGPSIAPLSETLCDQAVFTSAPSAVGEGYRIVASSSGVLAQEKAELTQRSPSHSSLCRSDDDAVGLTTSTLVSGRVCVASSVHAGAEHTGRGGQRVYTRALLLDPAVFLALGCDPVAVHVRVPVEVDPHLYGRGAAQQERIPEVSLARAFDRVAVPVASPEMGGDGRLVRCVAASLAAGESLVVVAPKIDPAALLEWVLLVTPLPLREGLSTSVGVRFSPSRRLRCTILGGDDPAARKAIRGHGIRWLDAGLEEFEDTPSSYDGWWALVSKYWSEGRQLEVLELAGRFGPDADPGLCSRVAGMLLEFDSMRGLEGPAVNAMLAKYQSFAPTSPLENELVDRIVKLGREILEAESSDTPA